MPKKKVTLSLDAAVYNEFQRYCEDNAIMLSKKIELVMKELMVRGNNSVETSYQKGKNGKRGEKK